METSIELTGNLNTDMRILQSQLQGAGTINVQFDNANAMSFKMDYQSEDKVLLTLQGTTSMQINSTGNLTLAGDATYNPISSQLSAGGTITFTVPQKVASSLDIRYDGMGGASAKLDLKINF